MRNFTTNRLMFRRLLTGMLLKEGHWLHLADELVHYEQRARRGDIFDVETIKKISELMDNFEQAKGFVFHDECLLSQICERKKFRGAKQPASKFSADMDEKIIQFPGGVR